MEESEFIEFLTKLWSAGYRSDAIYRGNIISVIESMRIPMGQQWVDRMLGAFAAISASPIHGP